MTKQGREIAVKVTSLNQLSAIKMPFIMDVDLNVLTWAKTWRVVKMPFIMDVDLNVLTWAKTWRVVHYTRTESGQQAFKFLFLKIQSNII